MVTLTKDGGVKYLSDDSSLIPALKKDGWVCEGEETSPDIKALKEEANKLGLKALKEEANKLGLKALKEEANKLGLKALKEEANKLGLKYHHRCSYETIKKLIEEAQK